ncbi:hypothetical protein ABEB36_012166 [Hypothenemus hampei]|uniref:TROVE domain-containing protein n=1 Tax=Hypothenemus hampei TaxID=57062 RepID=A0ABD1EEL8_HYPHA
MAHHSPSLNLTEKLKRLVYLTKINPHFNVGDPDIYSYQISGRTHTNTPDSQSVFTELLDEDLNHLFVVLDTANKDPNLPRRSALFYILAIMWQHDMKPHQKSKIAVKVIELIQCDEDFFTFIKYLVRCTKHKMPSSIEKIARKFYTDKTPIELARSAAICPRMFKWSHKDLLILSHFKSDSLLKNVVVNYILNGKVTNQASEEELEVLKVIKKAEELRRTTHAVNAIPIVVSEKFTMDQVSVKLQQNPQVWEAAISNMTIQQILPCLLKLYRLNLLKSGTTISNHITDLFTNPEKVKSSSIHPIQVFTFMKKFEKGGKPMDFELINYLKMQKKLSESDLKKAQTRTEIKCVHILNALAKCFELACNNVQATNKRYLLTIDVTSESKKAICIGSKFLTLLEAAVAYAIVLLRVEKDVTIATYKDDKVEFFSVGKKVSYADLLKKITAQSSTYSYIFAPVEWAASEKKHVDIFVNFIHNNFIRKVPQEKNLTKIKYEPILKYRSKVNLPNAKFLTFAPVNTATFFCADAPSNIVEILGFDTIACKVAECFSRGAFC